MIHHIIVEIDPQHATREVEFWGALGWRRDHQKHRGVSYKGEWLRSRFGEGWLWLRTGGAFIDREIKLCLAGAFGERMDNLILLPFAIQAEELPSFWSARHVRVWSPSGHEVDLLERTPPAVRYGPPDEVVEKEGR